MSRLFIEEDILRDIVVGAIGRKGIYELSFRRNEVDIQHIFILYLHIRYFRGGNRLIFRAWCSLLFLRRDV